MFYTTNAVLFYNGREVETDGKTLRGKFIAVIFNTRYAYLAKDMEEVEEVIDDYLKVNFLTTLEVRLKELHF